MLKPNFIEEAVIVEDSPNPVKINPIKTLHSLVSTKKPMPTKGEKTNSEIVEEVGEVKPTTAAVSSSWDRTGITYTNVAPGSKQSFTFTYSGSNIIKNVATSCSCTAAVHQGNVINGSITADKDLSRTAGAQATMSKTVTVHFTDGTKDTLTVSLVVNKLFKIK